MENQGKVNYGNSFHTCPMTEDNKKHKQVDQWDGDKHFGNEQPQQHMPLILLYLIYLQGLHLFLKQT